MSAEFLLQTVIENFAETLDQKTLYKRDALWALHVLGTNLQNGQFRAVAKSDVLQLDAIPLIAVHQLNSIRPVPYLHQVVRLLQVSCRELEA